MDFSKLVEIRRSCRKFEKADVLKQDIEAIISTTLMAPSWRNSETGRYYVALSEDAINEVYESLPDFNKKSSQNAAYIVATYKKGLSGYSNDGATKAGEIWGGYDLGLQNAYLCLKASELGYDTLIMGLRDEERLRKYFDISDDEIMLPVIAIGKKDGDLRLNPRSKTVNDVLVIK